MADIVRRNYEITFPWDDKSVKACLLLAEGYTNAEVARQCGVNETTIARWTDEPEFATEVDTVTLMRGAAISAWRMRFIKRAIRQSLAKDGKIRTRRDVLEWVKLAIEESKGNKDVLQALIEHALSDVSAGSSDGLRRTRSRGSRTVDGTLVSEEEPLSSELDGGLGRQ
jgi:transposase-like protein